MSATPIERLTVSACKVPTDAPESDGTCEWDSTTIVIVEAEAGDLPVITAAIRVVQRCASRRPGTALIVAAAAFADNIEHERRRIDARDRVRRVAIRADGRLCVSLRQLLPVNAGYIGFRKPDVAAAAGIGHVLAENARLCVA